MILMYHNIAEEPGFNTVSIANLKSQLEYLLKNNFKIVPLDVYLKSLDKKHNNPNTIVLTFDDAYTSFNEQVLPLLVELNVPATTFIPTGFIGKGMIGIKA